MILKNDIRLLGTFVFFFISVLTLKAQSWPAGIHDPSSIVKCDDTYWIFGTGDGIYSIYSKDLISWHDGPTPFTKTDYPAWINTYVGEFDGFFWAPDIIHMDDKYYLYYSCSEWGTMTSTIGCVTNKTMDPEDPEYEWVDVGFLGIWSYQPGLALNAIDPSLSRGQDGKIWMVYGSFNEEGIVITEIDSISGKPKTYAGNLPGKSIANSWTGSWYGEGEGAAMIYRDNFYYLFYNKGGCCNGIGSSYFIVMGRSASPKGPFIDKDGKALRTTGQASGGTVVLKHDNTRGTDDRYYGPGHFGMYRENGIDYVSFHYYDPNGYYPGAPNNQGGPTLGLAKLVWGEDGWPSISLNFLDEGVYAFENALSGKVADVSSHALAENAYLFQYALDSNYYTQKWVLNSLGTGEYTITNYADPDMYVEASGTNEATNLWITSDYTEEVNQKFRTVTSPNGQSIIYPSTKDAAWRLFSPTSSDGRISLGRNPHEDFQRWYALPFDEFIEVPESRITIDHTAGTDSVVVHSNGLWGATVLYDSWMSVEASGEKDGKVILTFDENPNVSDRRNRIYVTSNGGQSEMIVVTQPGRPTGIDDLADDNPTIIYPNPANQEVFVESNKNGQLSVYNQSGQKVGYFDIETGKNKLNISDFKSGIYLFRIVTANKTIVKKLVKN